MKKIEVFEAPDGRLFKTKRGYNAHIKKCEKEAKENAQRLKEIQEKNLIWQTKINDMKNCRLLAESLDDYFDRCREYFAKYFAEFEIEFFLEGIRFYNAVSNSHASPVDGVRNWSGKNKDLPTSYPGWCGTIYIFQKKGKSVETKTGRTIPPKAFGCNGSIEGLTTGSGGARTYNGRQGLGYDVSMFLQDFPLIEEQYKTYKRLETTTKFLLDDRQAHINRQIADSSTISNLELSKVELLKEVESLQKKVRAIDADVRQESTAIRERIIAAAPINTDELEGLKKLF